MARNPSLELSNPIESQMYLRQSTERERAAVQAEFLAGNWEVLRAFAALAAEGRLPRLAAVPNNPHARFWAGVLTADAPQRRSELLRYLLRAQLGSPPPPSKEVQAQLLRYFASFQTPSRTQAPDTWVGPRLSLYAQLPHERLVELARFLPADEVLPHLLRFLGTRRRYYQLHTDYTTHPEEVDGVLPATLRALIALAAQGGERERVRKALEEAARAPEEVDFEQFDDNEGQAPPTRTVRTVRLGAEHAGGLLAPVVNASELVSRKQWISWALEAIDGKRDALARFAPPAGRFARSEWAVLAGEGVYQQAHGSAYALTEGSLWSFDPETGLTRFRVPLTSPSSSSDFRFDSRSGAVTPDGHAAFVGELMGQGARSTWHVFLFDRETGEVLKDVPVAGNKPSSLVSARLEDVTLTSGKELWVQNPSGKILAKVRLASAPVLAADEQGVVALASQGQVSLLRPDLKPLGGWPVRMSDAVHGDDVEALLLTEQAVFALTPSALLTWRRSGEFLGARKLESVNTRVAPFWDGARVWVAAGPRLLGFSVEEPSPLVLPVPSEVRDMGPLGEGILVVHQGGLGSVTPRDKRFQPWPEVLTAHMSSLVRVGPKASLLLTYKDSRYWLIRLSNRFTGEP